MKKANTEAVKSMASIALYLVIIIGVWAILGKALFPAQTSVDTYGDFFAKNAPLMRQVAENALDPDVWPGIRETPEVQARLEELGVTDITVEDGAASFWLADQVPNALLRVIYAEDYVRPAAFSGGEWTEIETEREETRRWTCGQGFLNVRSLAERFWLEESLAP